MLTARIFICEAILHFATQKGEMLPASIETYCTVWIFIYHFLYPHIVLGFGFS